MLTVIAALFCTLQFAFIYFQLMETLLSGPNGVHAQRLAGMDRCIAQELAATRYLNSEENFVLEMKQRVGHVIKDLAVSNT